MGRKKKVIIGEEALNPDVVSAQKIKKQEKEYNADRQILEQYYRVVRGIKLVQVTRTNHGKHTQLIGVISKKNPKIKELINSLRQEGKIKEDIG